MEDKEAHEVLQDMLDTAVRDTVSTTQRIKDLKADYEKDPWEGTAAQITKVEARLERRTREAKALAVAVTKF